MPEKVHNARFLCVPADFSTDKSTAEQGAVYVRYTGPNGKPTTVHSLLTFSPQNQHMQLVLLKQLKKGQKQLTLTMNYWKNNLWDAPSMVPV